MQAIVNEHLVAYRDALGLPDWHIETAYGHDDGNAASVDLGKAAYRRARIIIDPAQHDSREEVLETLLHELLHIVLMPLRYHRISMRHQVAIARGADITPEFDAWEHDEWLRAEEHVVTSLERVLIQHLEFTESVKPA